MKETSDQQSFSRRNLLQLAAGLIGTGSLTVWLGEASAQGLEPEASQPKQNQPAAALGMTPAQNMLTPDEALIQLMEGNQRFVTKKRLNLHQNIARITEVATQQAPFAAILSCADSRVVPEIAFDQGIGDLFVVRVAGNIAVTEDTASEEYAVAMLGTPLLMVLGHERCGAVTAALKGGELPGVLSSLVLAIQPAVKASEGEPGDRLTNAVRANVRLQIQRLQTSPIIASAVQAGKLKVVGGFYDLDTGTVDLVSV
ncbi:MAG: carbonic anhydrase [Timaviella obliquedivisa GSE-PSE-MK23-08B]|nr:carbonic anhydrase [Timaviella obliquedivisa GSE-PSE-MK23-08B]